MWSMCVLHLGAPPGRGQGPQGGDRDQKGPECSSPCGLQRASLSRVGPAGPQECVRGSAGLLGTQDLELSFA